MIVEPGSTSFEMWETLPIPMYMKLFYFNVTNPEEIEARIPGDMFCCIGWVVQYHLVEKIIGRMVPQNGRIFRLGRFFRLFCALDSIKYINI